MVPQRRGAGACMAISFSMACLLARGRVAHQSPSGCRFTTRVRLRIMKPAGRLLENRSRERRAGQGERAADRQRLKFAPRPILRR